MRRTLATFLLSLTLLSGGVALLSACSTVHGAGEDLEHSSNAVRKSM